MLIDAVSAILLISPKAEDLSRFYEILEPTRRRAPGASPFQT